MKKAITRSPMIAYVRGSRYIQEKKADSRAPVQKKLAKECDILRHRVRARRACPLGSEITRSIKVCVNLIVALLAFELGLLGPVAALSVSTPRTHLTGVSGIFFNHHHPGHSSLIVNEGQKLRKGPGVYHSIDLKTYAQHGKKIICEKAILWQNPFSRPWL